MDNISAQRLVQTMIDYFEAGTKETDRAAKNIIEWDAENLAEWRAEMEQLREAGEWSGVRSQEADIISAALRLLLRVAQLE
jgi:hypothetical protein